MGASLGSTQIRVADQETTPVVQVIVPFGSAWPASLKRAVILKVPMARDPLNVPLICEVVAPDGLFPW
jgi:hypothetical protein